MRFAAAIVLASLVVVAPRADAFDVPITGTKLVLKQSGSGKQKLVFQSKDPSFPFPPRGGLDDPAAVGATIEVITPGAQPPVFEAPENAEQPGAWTYKFGAVPTYKYKRDKAYAATTAIKGIVIKSGRGITVSGDAVGIPLDGARGVVGLRLTIGDVRACARFDGAAVSKDAVGTFAGKNAATTGLTDCTAGSLTGQGPVCGDGEVDPSEQCDATCDFDLTCRPPGTANECICCSDGWPSAAPCCNPSSIAIYYPPSSKTCIPTRCDPPDACRSGDQCQNDGSCCTTLGGNLCAMAYAPPLVNTMYTLTACCPGLECRRASLPQGATCCAAGGTTCAGDGDCCTGHCASGTCEACQAGGVACGTNDECCSGACTSGTCAACGPTGTFCTSNATCCSGTCSAFHCL